MNYILSLIVVVLSVLSLTEAAFFVRREAKRRIDSPRTCNMEKIKLYVRTLRPAVNLTCENVDVNTVEEAPARTTCFLSYGCEFDGNVYSKSATCLKNGMWRVYKPNCRKDEWQKRMTALISEITQRGGESSSGVRKTTNALYHSVASKGKCQKRKLCSALRNSTQCIFLKPKPKMYKIRKLLNSSLSIINFTHKWCETCFNKHCLESVTSDSVELI